VNESYMVFFVCVNESYLCFLAVRIIFTSDDLSTTHSSFKSVTRGSLYTVYLASISFQKGNQNFCNWHF